MSRSGKSSVAFIPRSRRPGFLGIAVFSRGAGDPFAEGSVPGVAAGSTVMVRSLVGRPGPVRAPGGSGEKSAREERLEVLEVRLPVAGVVVAGRVVGRRRRPARVLELDPRPVVADRLDRPRDERL